MKRRSASDDSLDLFLDTICNMFGGIIFVVMLLVLLSFGRTAAVLKGSGLTDARQKVLMQERQEKSKLEVRKVLLEEALTALRGDIEQVQQAIPPDIRERIDVLLAQVASARAELKRYEEFGHEWRLRQKDTTDKIGEQQELVEELTAKADRIRHEIDLVKRSRTGEARLHVLRKTPKQPVWIMLRNKQAYLLYALGEGAAGNLPDRRDVIMQPFERGNLFTTKPGGVFPITSGLDDEPRWVELVRKVDPKLEQLVFAVYPDSYEAFLLIKAATLRAGLQYDVVPLADNEPMALGPGRHNTTQ